MVRPVALFIATFVMSSLVVYLATASAFGQSKIAKANDVKQRPVLANSCQIEFRGKVVQLHPGQGIETVDGWQNCQTYDGHSFIAYSTKPPKSAVIENDR